MARPPHCKRTEKTKKDERNLQKEKEARFLRGGKGLKKKTTRGGKKKKTGTNDDERRVLKAS